MSTRYLKSAPNIGQIIKVPGPVLHPTRFGPTRWYWADAIVREVYQAKGGLAVRVEQVVQDRIGEAKYLVAQCKTGRIDIDANYFEEVRKNQRPVKASFWNNW